MLIRAKVKDAGKKRAFINKEYNLPDSIKTLSDFIKAIVSLEVKEYNDKEPDNNIVFALSNKEIEGLAESGKVGFGRRFGLNDADVATSIEVAEQAFKDGLYRVFIDEEEAVELESELNLKDGIEVVFIRLTFLAGRMF